MELGKIPPNDVEAEQAVIGSMLTDRDAVISAIEVLKEEDFYREDNKTIYEAILNLYNRSEPIDIITLKAELTSMGTGSTLISVGTVGIPKLSVIGSRRFSVQETNIIKDKVINIYIFFIILII